MSAKISIETIAKFSDEHSQKQLNRFVFTYLIKIFNNGIESAQLLSRYWKITDANGEIQEVRGEGVVGEQPIIMPSAFYQYESFCLLPTPLGWMEGTYRMIYHNGEIFEVNIPRFVLEIPGIRQ